MLSVGHERLQALAGGGDYLVNSLLRRYAAGAAFHILRTGHDIGYAGDAQDMLNPLHVIRESQLGLQDFSPGHVIAFYQNHIAVGAEVLLVEVIVKLIEGGIFGDKGLGGHALAGNILGIMK